MFCWYEIGVENRNGRINIRVAQSGSARFEVGTSHRLGGTVLNSEN